MKILLSPSRNEWYIESGDGCYTLDNKAEVELAVSVLPLRIINDYKEVEQISFEGSAAIVEIENDVMKVELKDIVGNRISLSEIKIDDTCLCSIDWQERPFQDGWVGAHSQVRIDNVSSYALKVFAPAIEGHADKIVNIENKTTGNKWSFTLVRGQENTITLMNQPADGRQEFVLQCAAEPIDDSTDTRDLGFVLVDDVMTA